MLDKLALRRPSKLGENQSKGKSDWIGTLWVIAGVFFFCAWQLFDFDFSRTTIPSYGDLQQYFLPLWRFFRQSILSGQLPVWDDSQELGFYFLGNPQCSVFYLPNYLLLLPEPWGYHAYLAFAFCLHGVGLYLLFRRWAFKVAVAVLASLAITCSAPVVGLYSMATVLHLIAWLPWLMLLVQRPVRGPRVWLLAFALSQSFLAGASDLWPFYCLMVSLLVVRRSHFRDSGLLWAAGLAFLFVLPQLVQTVLYLPLTIRKDSVSLGESLFWSAGWQHLFGLFSPNSQISSLTSLAWMLFFDYRKGWLLSTYVSAPFVLLLPAIALRLFRARPLAFTYTALLLVLSAVGNSQSLGNFLFSHGVQLPIRYPDKLIGVALYGLMLFTARDGLVWTIGCLRSSRRWRFIALELIWVASMPLIFISARTRWLESFIASYQSNPENLIAFRSLYEYLTTKDLITCMTIGVLTLAVLSWARNRRKLFLLVFWSIFLGDVLLSGTKWEGNGPFVPSVIWPEKRPEVFQTRQEPVRWLKIQQSGGGKGDLSGLEEITGADSTGLLWPTIFLDPQIATAFGAYQLEGANVLPLRNSRKLIQSLLHPLPIKKEIFWRTGTEVVLGLPGDVNRFLPILDSCWKNPSDLTVCRIDDENIRLARIFSRAWVYPRDSITVRRMLEQQKDRSAAYLTDTTLRTHGLLLTAPSLERQDVRVQEWRGASKRFALTPGAGGWLMVAQAFHPWWRATSDQGQDLRVQRGDYALTCIWVPPGVREIELRFHPKYLLVTCLVSTFGALLILFLSFWLTRSRVLDPVPPSRMQ